MNASQLMRLVPLLGAALLGAACASPRAPAVPAPDSAATATEPAIQWSGLPAQEEDSRHRPVVGIGGAVSADDREAAEWGARILREGGNAVDAAVAVAFMMAVTRPHYASLGGGGFMTYCPSASGRREQGEKPRVEPRGSHVGDDGCAIIDFREEAPARATRDMYLVDGKPRPDLAQDGALASGTPGVVAGMLLALEKHGSKPRAKLLSEPIRVARRGSRMTGHMEAVAFERWKAFNDEARRLFACAKPGTAPLEPCLPGSLIRQPELARVLEEISKKGAAGFYKGWVAAKLAKGIQDGGGILSVEDLAAYRAREREPVRAPYRGWTVVSMPPPSAGGTTMLQMFRYAELADQAGAFAGGFGSAPALHAEAHAMGLAFADRAVFFGDPDHVRVPTAALLDPAYLDRRWSETYRPGAAAIPPGPGKPEAPREGANTTHFSVIDRRGNAVSVTVTVNDNFGSGFVPPGTGVVMNNQMDDFSIQAGVPNQFGLVGAEANAVGPRKRPLSSMSPTIVRDADGNNRIVIGAQGGPRITTGVFQALLNRLRFGMALQDAVAAPRIHEQWKPSALRLERHAFGAETRAALAGLGYSLEDTETVGKLHALERFPSGRVWGVSDPRAEGAVAVE